MNKELVIIGGAVGGGMVSNGISVLLPQSDSPIINFALAGASAFAVTKVSGSDTKANLLKGALIGNAVVQALIGVKKVSDKHLGDKLTGTGKLTTFSKGALGLGCPYDGEAGLNGQFMGSDGQVYEIDENAGLNGTFMDENGNLLELADDGLQGAFEDELYDTGLQGEATVLDELYS